VVAVGITTGGEAVVVIGRRGFILEPATIIAYVFVS